MPGELPGNNPEGQVRREQRDSQPAKRRRRTSVGGGRLHGYSYEEAPTTQESSEMRYARLRADVQKWIDREQEKKRAWIEGGRKEEEEGYDPHTDRINYEHLTEIDLDFWEKLQSLKQGKPFPMDDWERYDAAFQASIDKRQASSTSSRREFRAAMGNQVAIRNIIAEEQRTKKSQG